MVFLVCVGVLVQPRRSSCYDWQGSGVVCVYGWRLSVPRGTYCLLSCFASSSCHSGWQLVTSVHTKRHVRLRVFLPEISPPNSCECLAWCNPTTPTHRCCLNSRHLTQISHWPGPDISFFLSQIPSPLSGVPAVLAVRLGASVVHAFLYCLSCSLHFLYLFKPKTMVKSLIFRVWPSWLFKGHFPLEHVILWADVKS